MKEQSTETTAGVIWLTRSEAARYVGVSSESAIRAAEDKGLESVTDDRGQTWLWTDALDRWKWRKKQPSQAEKARVVREAQRSREREQRDNARRQAAEADRDLAEWDAQIKRFETEDALRASVRQKANELRAAFEHAHMDERTAGMALGFPSHEARYRVRDLVRRGLLRRVESPTEPRVEVSFDGAREVQSSWPLCHGGPFISREDVLALRKDTTEFAGETLSVAPKAVRDDASGMTDGEIVAELLRVLLEKLGMPR